MNGEEKQQQPSRLLVHCCWSASAHCPFINHGWGWAGQRHSGMWTPYPESELKPRTQTSSNLRPRTGHEHSTCRCSVQGHMGPSVTDVRAAVVIVETSEQFRILTLSLWTAPPPNPACSSCWCSTLGSSNVPAEPGYSHTHTLICCC